MEGFGVFIPVGEVAQDRLFQTPHAGEAAAADGLAGDQRKPALDPLDQIESRGTGPSEVHVEAGMRGQPLFDRRLFMRSVVVADQVQFPPRVASRQ